MTKRRTGMFRGSELTTLILLGALVVVGWPTVLYYARPRSEPPPPSPAPVASSLTPIVPDGGIEFEALIDKTPMQSRDNPAYQILLRRARETPPAQVAKAARRDVLFTHLLERPERYRGVPVHLEGTVLRVLTYEVNPELAPGGRVYEAWLYSDENRRFPYVVIFEEPPKGFPIGPEVRLRVTFDGYFLKLLRYLASDSYRVAPLLVGRLNWVPPPPTTDRSAANWHGFSGRNAIFLVLGLTAAYVALRVFFLIRRSRAPRRSSSSRITPREGLPPDDVARWLQDLPGDDPDDDEEDEEKHRPRHGD